MKFKLEAQFFGRLVNPNEARKLAPIVVEMPPEQSGGGIGA